LRFTQPRQHHGGARNVSILQTRGSQIPGYHQREALAWDSNQQHRWPVRPKYALARILLREPSKRPVLLLRKFQGVRKGRIAHKRLQGIEKLAVFEYFLARRTIGRV